MHDPAQPRPVIPVAAPGFKPLPYSLPFQMGRPGLVTAIGVVSIVVASLSLLFSTSSIFQAITFFAMSRMASSATTTTATSTSGSVTVSSSSTSSVSVTPVTGTATTAPTTTPASAATALTPAEVSQVVSRVQTYLGNRKLNAAQVASLQAQLQNPAQQLVTPGTAWSPLTSASLQSDGTASINFSGGFIVIDPRGTITSQFSNAAGMGSMPHISIGAAVLVGAEGLASLLLAILLLVAGILTLRQSRKSPRLHRIYAWTKIPLAILGGIGYGWMMSDMLSSMGGASLAAGSAIFAMYAVFLGGLACAYPIGLLIALRARSVRNYYNSIGEEQPVTSDGRQSAPW